jgi:hypothetical protein
MKRTRPANPRSTALLACSLISLGMAGAGHAQAPAAGAQAPAVKQAELPVQRVTLFSSGVGYFQHGGKVSGNAGAELKFTTKQINDVLKSLVLQDLDGGLVSAVTYPSLDPLAKTLGSFQINISENPPMADLLNQIRGAQVTVTVEAQEITGTVVGVEKRERHIIDHDEMVEEFYLNLLAGGSIRSVALASVRDIRIHDAQLQEELNKALAAVAKARDQDKKPVSLHFNGAGDRRVVAGYVVETPVWKTSYRLLLNGDKPSLQGWAIIENQTDNDWNNIELSLISGRPISFTQDLYQPLYLPRPEVKPELYSSLRPQMYQEGMAPAPPAIAPQAMLGEVRGAGKGSRAMSKGMAMEAMAADTMDGDPFAAPMDASASITSMANAENLGELFQYTVPNVSLPRQQSSLIPIITDAVQAKRLSIYNSEVLDKHPLNGVRLTNKGAGAKHLLQGPVTVFDANQYAGDARLNDTPPGQERLLSYGVDLNVLVDSKKNTQDSVVESASINRGVLNVQRKLILTREYVADNKGESEKVLLIEHPFRQGWKLVKTAVPVETTNSLYRFELTLPAGKQATLPVQEEFVQMETVGILPADFGLLDVYQKNGAISKDVREALGKAITMKQRMVELQRQVNEREQNVARITQEQERLRENLQTVQQQGDYRTRLLKKLDEQETVIEKLNTERDDLRGKFEQQRKELEDYLGGLTVS